MFIDESRQNAISIKTGKMVNIHDVSNGLSCNCKCPECGMAMEACQGDNTSWYFRHAEANPNCKYYVQQNISELKIPEMKYKDEYISWRDIILNAEDRKTIDDMVKNNKCPICNDNLYRKTGKDGTLWITCNSFPSLRSHCGFRCTEKDYKNLMCRN